MIRPREWSTKEMIGALPKEVRAQFLALDPAERDLLLNGTDAEKQEYGWLPKDAGKRYAKLPETIRVEEAKAGWRARQLERPAPVSARRVAPVSAACAVPAVGEVSARVTQSMRDIFELEEGGVERVQSMATNYLQTGSNEAQTIDQVAQVLIDELPMAANEPSPSRMQVMFGAGNVLRG